MIEISKTLALVLSVMATVGAFTIFSIWLIVFWYFFDTYCEKASCKIKKKKKGKEE